MSASVLREIESSYWLEGAPPLKKAYSTTSQESTRLVMPDAEPVMSSGMLTTIYLFYLPIF
ncbi:MAG: hypothetical protein ACPG4O_15205 [bacterium]